MKTGSSTASIPNPTPLLFLITAIAILLWPDATAITALSVAAAIVVPVALIWFSTTPTAAVIALVAASAVPRLFVDIGGLKARPEHIVSGLMLLAIPFLWKRRQQPVRWIAADYFLVAYAALNVFSSVFMSTAPSQTFKWAMQQVLAIVPYFWLRILIADRKQLSRAFRILLVAGAAASAYAIFSFYSNRFLGTDFGVEVLQYGDIPATYGLQFEANILGAYSGALCVMMLVMYLYERSRNYLIACTFLGMIAMAVSLSRGALGATLIAVLMVGFFALKRRLLDRKAVLSLATAALCAAMVVAPFVFEHYTERFSTLDVSDPIADPNTLTRAVQTVSAIDDVYNHPIFGGGTSSFQLTFDWQSLGTVWEEQGWIGNTELRVLHDTGVVGLLSFALFVAVLARNGWKLLRKEAPAELVALLAGAVVFSISFQATEGTLLAFTWVHLGLIGCALSVMNGKTDSGSSAPAQLISV